MFQPAERIALAALDRPTSSADWLRLIYGLKRRSGADPGFWWLDSAMHDSHLGQHSFAGSDPYLWLNARGKQTEIEVRRAVRPGLPRGFHRFRADPFECTRSLLPRVDSLVYSTRTSTQTGNPLWHEVDGLSSGMDFPFIGGAVGYFGYELGAEIEPRIHFENLDDLEMPDLSLAFVDRVLGYDHQSEQLWVFGLGFGDAGSSGEEEPRETAVERSRHAADEMAAEVERILRERPPVAPPKGATNRKQASLQISSTVDASSYTKSIDKVLEEIAAGNVYQANYSQRLTIEAPLDPWQIYTSLRAHNPAPFGAYLALPNAAILSSSPERFLRMNESRAVESRPIKGTRPRGEDAFSDAQLSEDLSQSEKDRAENLMIVDLVRNDLGRVCAPGSIEVPELMKIEAYAAVFQMVSTVTGTLATGRDALDLVKSNFPPGSMTGAPKLASVELIESLEHVRRGVYAGALGYLDLRGGLDLSVVIRTLVCKDGRAHLHVGGGVVADSSPEDEYLESLDKARAPLRALKDALSFRSEEA